MVEQIFNKLAEQYNTAAIQHPASIYFSIDDTKKTVFMTPDSCRVEDGRTVENADCVCKTSGVFFLKVWNEDYRPGKKDFLSGTIKSNNPSLLKSFLTACGKG
jgi:putative sterol carrier protein